MERATLTSSATKTCLLHLRKKAWTRERTVGISATEPASAGPKNGSTEPGQVRKAELSRFSGLKPERISHHSKSLWAKKLLLKTRHSISVDGRERSMARWTTLFQRDSSPSVTRERMVATTSSSSPTAKAST